VLDTVIGAARAVLGSAGTDAHPDTHFTDLGGDSLWALTFSNLLAELLGVDLSVGVIVSPASNLGQIARQIEADQPEHGYRRSCKLAIIRRAVAAGVRLS
jgi:fatty acid CoA ligase FadD9